MSEINLSAEGKSLIGNYEEMFADPNFTKQFAGAGWQFILGLFRKITANMDSYTLLDYGSGTATQLFWPVQAFGGQTFHQFTEGKCQCYYAYDPSVEKFSKRPTPGSKFSIIVCLEVMEHILEEDVPKVFEDIKSYLEEDGIVIFSIAGGPSRTLFPDGSDPHVTQRPQQWWETRIRQHFGSKFGLAYHP